MLFLSKHLHQIRHEKSRKHFNGLEEKRFDGVERIYVRHCEHDTWEFDLCAAL